MDGFTPIRGKCAYWRERMDEEERHSASVKAEDKRVVATCFIEGDRWVYTASTLPKDCPQRRQCRYYVKAG
jgi:hypothetical protein